MIGTSLGPYRVLERLGSGGMGEVFLADDTRLKRQVALKRLTRGSTSGPEARARVLREARAVARLQHPGIGSIFDVVEDADTVWIVMEYVRGETLAARLARGRVPVAEAIAIATQIADALASAHAQGVLHCDLKPANVHLTPDGQTKILDFGLAQRSSVAMASAETQSASVAIDVRSGDSARVSGSPGYMAPERISGQPPDERSDVYGLGVMLFELLTGRRPYSGNDLVSVAVTALTSPVPSPSSIDAAIPASLGALVVKAIAREPAARFQRADEMAAALRAFAAGRSLSRRRPGRAGLMAGAALLIVLAGAFATMAGWRPWSWIRPGSPTASASGAIVVTPFRNMTGDTANDHLGVGITDDLTTKLSTLPHVTVVSRATTSAYVAEHPSSRTLARDLGAAYVVDGGLQRSGDQLRVTVTLQSFAGTTVWAHEYEGALADLFTLQHQIAEGLADSLNLTLSTTDRRRLADEPTRNVEAFADYAQGRLFLDRLDAKGNVDHAVEAFERAVAKDPAFALAHAGLGSAYWAKFKETSDAAWTARAVDASLEALRLNPNQAEVHVALGLIYQGLGRTPAAVDELQKALAIHPTDEAHRLIGDIFAKESRTDDAVAAYQRAIQLRPNYWQNHNRLAVALMRAGRYQEATASCRRVTELQPDSAVGFNNLGVVAMMQGDLAMGLSSLTRAAEISPKASTFSNIGTVQYWNGRFADARHAYEQAIALKPNDASLVRNLGDAWAGEHNVPEARKAYVSALAFARNQLKVNPKDATTLSLAAILEAKLDRPVDARADVDRALALAPKDAEVYYRSAVVAALARDRPAALAALKSALAQGYSRELMGRDLDLQSLKGLPEFTALLSSSRQ
jgi:tetratricopeptide (TPR) repeat protein